LESIAQLKTTMKTLKLPTAADALNEFLMQAEEKQWTNQELLSRLLTRELNSREQKRLEKHLKLASFPEYLPLEGFDLSEQPSISQKQFNQLRELHWLEQAYNLIVLGPPGVGKTLLSTGLGIEAIRQGYRVQFTSMDDVIHLLKTQEITRFSRSKLKRITSADLVILDDLMFMAIDHHEANLFFQLINKLYGQTSIIITSNKGPEDWGEILGDPAITTAILDRLLHKSEVLNLVGDSYRLKHRQTIFGTSQSGVPIAPQPAAG